MDSINKIDYRALVRIMACRNRLTGRQYRILREQALTGDGEGALAGLREILLWEGTNAVKKH